ncbi:hypothetical protein [Glutamicibacter sp. NPDC087344]|uniref:hypothetical protein n=1 Tax=Glutamicibacter sp. NPDC087344 TaxID=3363994 RepID=UPI0038217E8A
MSKCISAHGEYSEHTFTHDPECDYCGEPLPNRVETMRTALVAIQELHKPFPVYSDECPDFDCELEHVEIDQTFYHDVVDYWACGGCCKPEGDADEYVNHPCRTRQLADKGLEGDRG